MKRTHHQSAPTAAPSGPDGPPRVLLPGPWYLHCATIAALVVITCVLYMGDLHLGFFGVDDPDYVTNNSWIRRVSTENIGHVLTQPYFANYSPLHILSYMLDYAMAGSNPYAFHLSSNLWAGIVAGMVYLVALAVFARWWVAVVAGALFVVHPAHVEAVVWISSRKDLLAAAFALPAILCYLAALRRTPRRNWWYAASIMLFALAVGSKQSVVIVPGILFVYDWFVEKRPGWMMWADKLPFLMVAGFFALRTFGAQPATGFQPSLYTTGHSLAKSLWLLTGLGEYTLYRPRPDADAAMWIKQGFSALPFALFIVPLLLRRWLQPMVIVLIYWVLLALLPAQTLSLVHPVTDRYLFFPSVAMTMFIAWAASDAAKRWGKPGRTVAVVLVAGLAAIWSHKTLAYLGEWQDARSVWFAAVKKSGDVEVYSFLGDHYHDAADALDAARRANTTVPDSVRRLAGAVWADDARLASLLDEWQHGSLSGTSTHEFQKALRDFAWTQYEQAVHVKGTRITPNLYFRRGKLELDRGNPDRARAEFHAAYDESQRHTFQQVREELAVRSHYALGVVEWTVGNYDEALRWLRMAEEEQARFGGTWEPGLRNSRERLEGLIRARQEP